MTAEFDMADDSVIDTAQDIIHAFHPHLEAVRIGFLFRSEASTSKGRKVLAQVQKVTPQMQALTDLEFVIWVSEPDWEALPKAHRKALIDHECCHLAPDLEHEEGTVKIVGHDIEEHLAVIQRHGLWSPMLSYTARAIQPHLPGLEGEGAIRSLNREEVSTIFGQSVSAMMDADHATAQAPALTEQWVEVEIGKPPAAIPPADAQTDPSPEAAADPLDMPTDDTLDTLFGDATNA